MRSWFPRLFLALFVLVLAGIGCTKKLSPEVQQASQPFPLRVWGVIDDADAYRQVFDAYRTLHPQISIDYRRFRLEEYERELIDALAEDRGPDIFLIHNDWLGKYQSKVVPMPTATKTAYQIITGTVKKERTWELRSEPTISLRSYKEQYADAVLKDTIRVVNVSTAEKPEMQERIMGAPVGLDTLALFYNKDLLNAAGIATPADNWSQFQEQVKKLVKQDAQGNILQAGAGIGAAQNVERATDILIALMLQNGTVMADEKGEPVFTQVPLALGDREVAPAVQALQFYTDFANPNKVTYTWNGGMPNSLEAFIRGTSAFFFGYSYHLPLIKARAPRLNLGVTKMPQIENNPPRSVANYWFWVVSKKSQHQDEAWNFLNFLLKPDQTKTVLAQAGRPAARKALLAEQLNDERVGVFASQVLTAVSWYRGRDPQAMEAAFLELINNALAGTTNLADLLRYTESKVEQTIR